MEKIANKVKLDNVKKEFFLLNEVMKDAGISTDSREFENLKRVNNKLWEIENNIRLKEAKHEFDDEFIQLARSVYFENDNRAAIKREINIKFGSELIEEKDYSEYRR